MLVEVPCAYFLMVLGIKMLGVVIGQIFLSWVPLHIKQPSVDLVCDKEKYHFHRA